jgi:membrane fusion protein (multidrug efflux system)
VRPGSSAGVSLYQIDPATYQASYDSAKGDLAKAQAAANMDQLARSPLALS